MERDGLCDSTYTRAVEDTLKHLQEVGFETRERITKEWALESSEEILLASYLDQVIKDFTGKTGKYEANR